MGSMDLTVFPANSEYMKAAYQIMGSVLAMSSAHCGWIMLPVLQSQTNENALSKHRRQIEDSMKLLGVSLQNESAILFERAEGARDGRPLPQVARLALHKSFVQSSAWNESTVVTDGRCGPCQLLRISDFIDYDPDVRLGPAARLQQKLGQKLLQKKWSPVMP